jgi:hypothetical protein
VAKFWRDVGGYKKPVTSKTRLVDVGVENLFYDGGEEDEVPDKLTKQPMKPTTMRVQN